MQRQENNYWWPHPIYRDPIQLSDTQFQLSDTQLGFVWGPIPELSPTMFWCYSWHNSLSNTSYPRSDTLKSYWGDKLFFVQDAAHIGIPKEKLKHGEPHMGWISTVISSIYQFTVISLPVENHHVMERFTWWLDEFTQVKTWSISHILWSISTGISGI